MAAPLKSPKAKPGKPKTPKKRAGKAKVRKPKAGKGAVVEIGWREYVDLPTWGIRKILAKVDTGARSSAIDVSHVEERPGDRVYFEVISDRGGELKRTALEAPVARRTRVRSSFGTTHERIFVEVTVRLAEREFQTEVGLVDRENMICRMLLGRKSLGHTYRVDPGRCYLHGKRRRRRLPRKRGESAS